MNTGTFLGYRNDKGEEMHCAHAKCISLEMCLKGCRCPVAKSAPPKWLLMLVKTIFGEKADIRNLGDVRWHATEDGSQGKGTGRHIAQFILRASQTRG